MMNKPRFYALSTSIVLFLGVLSNVTAKDGQLNGKQLFVEKGCTACHGADGRSPVVLYFPKIAGQNAGYLYNQLRDTKSGSRNNSRSAIMRGITVNTSHEEMRAIANWLTTQ